MVDFTVYINGEFVPESQAHLSIADRGFTLGDGVFDTARTFRHAFFHLDDHLARLYRSLRYVYIDPGLSPIQLRDIAEQVLYRNIDQVDREDDVVLTIRVSRGTPGEGPTRVVTCRPIAFDRFAHLYAKGVELVTPTVRAISRDIMDPRVKTQSRIVNVLAEIQANAARPGAWPLLCNSRGIITESSRASFLMVQNDCIMTPKGGRVLAGVTAAVTTDLAEGLDYRVEERDLTPYDALLADEALITSTSMCVLPVQSINGSPIGSGQVPGRVTSALMDAWKTLTGVDFVLQALAFSERAIG
jgi:branched-chain amino acid aminotransferase